MNDVALDDPYLGLYRFVFEHAPNAILISDAEGHLVLSNPSARDLPPELIEGLFADHEPHAVELRRFREQLKTLGRAHTETRFDGRTIAVEGRTYGERRLISACDVTDERRRDAELRALRRVESIGHFTASLIHDFNNLLTPIACLSACLEGELEANEHLRPVALAMAHDIRAAAERAAGLARQTLQWVRREPPRPEVIDLGPVLAELKPLVERVVGGEVQVQLSAPTNAGAASLDRERFEHALLNLVANARDAMPSGGRLTLSATRMSFAGDDAGAMEGAGARAYVAVHVSDTGVGMKKEVRERIFQPFFTTKEAGSGTGLGLEAVRRFVADSGGCISVQTEEGRGTTVSLHFPLVDVDCPAPAVERNADATGSETVLVVDDDDRVRGALQAVLRSHGYRVQEASCGADALDIVRRGELPVDVVIADVVMPGMTGLELARRLRSMNPIPVLYTSGHTERRLERCGWRPEAGPLLRKAFGPSELLRSVRMVLDAK
jgi:signal transduction histidine kinase